ncbi:CHAT domain-containing protein [Mucilaginibacter mali]|uniref:CHAT domain-containing protein n=1 Tax=Mucilaginibacter mali TaxID=2740462 RepID=A0A7D4UM49_9SPHI|nr:CHAT domain-containing tetratricopeptide repeat protein [Mucilaginibacter mali]QKJ30741.1 CHAT domain-containing protein [Mucilaginibacter mali]
MFLPAKRIYTLCCLLFCGLISYAQDAATQQQLDGLKKQNNLTEWLYTRIDFTNNHPQALSFLMETQKQMWRQPANDDERFAVLTLISSQGYDQLQAGDILSSINCYEQAYAYYYKYKLAQFDAVEYIFKPLSNNYTRLGDYERGIFIQQKAIDKLIQLDDADNAASVYNNMAISYYSMGNRTLAEDCVAKGQQLAKSPAVRFRLQNMQADILYDKGDYVNSAALLKQNIASQKNANADNAGMLIGAYTTLGNINLKVNRLDEAQQYFDKALTLIKTYFPDSRQREKANLMAQLGKIERLRKHPQQALDILNGALRVLRINTVNDKVQATDIYGENNLVDIFREKALTYLLLGRDGRALDNLRYALLATDKIRTEFADDKTKERLQQESRELVETTLAIAYNYYHPSGDQRYANLMLEICEQSKARTLADQIRKNSRQMQGRGKDTVATRRLYLERAIIYDQKMAMTEKDKTGYEKKIATLKFELALLNKNDRRQNTVAPISAKALLPHIPDSLHVVEYFVGNYMAYAINIYHGNIYVRRNSNAHALKNDIDRMVGTYYRNGPAAMLNSPKQFFQLSYNIYWDLLGSVKTGEHLLIIPDDVIGYLSFDGLITDNKYDPAISRWPYLIKKATITYVFSLNTLIQNKAQKLNGNGFSGLFITHDGANDKPIVAVNQEAASIKQLVAGNYLYNDDVDIKAFHYAFGNSSALHISTHAYLSGADKEPTLDLGKEKLFLFELLASRSKPQLVVLSACRTGDGLLAKGEGIISLSRGFSAIGTPATVASLWNVNDQTAAGITAGMYAGLAKNQSTGTALHNAKLNWLNTQQTSDTMYLPYYWDSLVLMGADAVLPLKPAHSYLVLYIILAGVTLFILSFLIWRKTRMRK